MSTVRLSPAVRGLPTLCSDHRASPTPPTDFGHTQFYLNPRYLRGSDFLMRWSQGRWAEHIILDAFARDSEFRAIAYGPSSVAPEDPKALERYFERLDAAATTGKRPDLLILSRRAYEEFERELNGIGIEEIPFTPESNLRFLLDRALIGIEVENSLWKGRKMPHYGKGRPVPGYPDLIGFAKSHKVPTVIVKKEDMEPLAGWQEASNIPIYVFHVFYDCAYFISFDRIRDLIQAGVIGPTRQIFQAPGGATTSKDIYKVWYSLCEALGEVAEPPELTSAVIEDKNGHILPYVHFSKGRLELSQQIRTELQRLARRP